MFGRSKVSVIMTEACLTWANGRLRGVGQGKQGSMSGLHVRTPFDAIGNDRDAGRGEGPQVSVRSVHACRMELGSICASAVLGMLPCKGMGLRATSGVPFDDVEGS